MKELNKKKKGEKADVDKKAKLNSMKKTAKAN